MFYLYLWSVDKIDLEIHWVKFWNIIHPQEIGNRMFPQRSEGVNKTPDLPPI